jgi:hypothetical protein
VANDAWASALFSAHEKSSTYSSEYASGFSRPAAAHLPAPHSPRDEQQRRTGSSRKFLPNGLILRVRISYQHKRDIPKWLFHEMLRQAGLTLEEFRALLNP